MCLQSSAVWLNSRLPSLHLHTAKTGELRSLSIMQSLTSFDISSHLLGVRSGISLDAKLSAPTSLYVIEILVIGRGLLRLGAGAACCPCFLFTASSIRAISSIGGQQFSMEALHHIMMSNNCQILGMYDEMSVMYGQLDAYKHSGSRLDRSTLLDLYDGGSWSRNFRNKEQAMVKMQQTAFNMCGFIQPAFVLSMLDSSDPDVFNDRQFFICPEEVEYLYSDLEVPMDPTVVHLEDIFRRIKYAHQKMIEHRFDDAAKAAFIRARDELCTRKMSIPDDEDRRGILSKARGQLARMAMTIHSLEQAVEHPMNASEICSSGESLPTEIQWNATIKEDSVIKAEVITEVHH